MKIELSLQAQKRLLFTIIGMLFVTWVILGRIWLNQREVKIRLEERQQVEKLLIVHKDSVLNETMSEVKNLKATIHKMDSVLYIMYLKNITDGK